MTAAARPPRRLADRLASTLVAAIGAVWLPMAIGSAWQLGVEIDEGMDSTLVLSAERLLELASDRPAPPPQPDERHAGDADDDLEYQVVDAAGRLLRRSLHAPERPLAAAVDGRFSEGGGWRVYTRFDARRGLAVHVADAIDHRVEARQQAIGWLLLPMLGVLPVLFLLIRWAVRRSLLPLQRLAEQIARRGGRDLAAIAAGPLPAELQVIERSTNHLLLRLGEALNTERALAANAAHELRTPLAAARLRLHALLAMDLPAAARAEAGHGLAALEQLGRRAEKLLQMSRAESAAALQAEPVPLGELAGVVAQEFWADPALLDRLRIQVPEEADVVALGDADALAIVVRNLVENALRHGGGHVEIVIEPPAVIRVRDDGPGVPGDALDRIRERHARRSADRTGFGLGLAIVATIVERHGGRWMLRSPPTGMARGFEAEIRLRPAPG